MSKDTTRLPLRATLSVTAAAAACAQLAGATPPSSTPPESPYAHNEQGQFRTCATFGNPAQEPVVLCDTDFDASGTITSADVSAFVRAWVIGVSSGAPAPDFNTDGVVTSADITAFITAWSSELTGGC